MASFEQNLKNTASQASAYSLTTSETGSGYDVTTDTFTVSDKYLWYEEYKDDDYATIDSAKNIKISSSQVNLTQEANSQVIPFLMDRYCDGIDLMDMFLQIRFVNSQKDESTIAPINVMYSDTKIKFYFLVPAEATAIAGKLKMEIIAEGTNERGQVYRWRTKPNEEINILQSLVGNGVIEPTQGWDSYIEIVNKSVLQAQTAAEEAKEQAETAQLIAEEVQEKLNNSADIVADQVIADLQVILEQYYTADEVDILIENMDFTEVLAEVEKKIDAIDGLANLKVEYDNTTNTMTFKNGETVIVSHILNTNPTAEWTSTFRGTVKEDIDAAVKTVSDEMTVVQRQVTENTTAIQNIEDTHYTSEETDVLLGNKADAIEVSNIKTSVAKVETKANTNADNITIVSEKVSELEETIGSMNTEAPLEYDVNYNAETGVFQFVEIEEDVETVKKQFTITGGSGGSGSATTTTVKIERITSSPVTVTKNDRVIIKYSFSSIDSAGDTTDAGSATWKVGSSVVATSIALQGDNEFDITDYLTVGSQKITLSITDSAGTVAVKTWTVQVIDLYIDSTFSDKFTYPLGDITFAYTPYGAVSKEVHFILDGKEIGSVTTTNSGLPMSYTIPAQTHGAHLLDVYMTATVNGTSIETNHIVKDILWYDETSNVPVIGCVTQKFTALQYDSTNIEYTVYDPNTETPKVTLAIDDEVVSTLTLESPTQIWQYKSTEIGVHTLTITCGSVVKTIKATITELDIDVEPVTANLAFDFNPVGYSNNDENRLWTNGIISMTVSDNFDWTNGGYQIDANGDQYFCIKAGTSANIDYKLFEDDAKKNGKEMKLVFKTTNVQNVEAKFLSCVDNTTGSDFIGIEMFAHEAYIYGATADHLQLPYSEEDIIEFEFNISKNTEAVPMVMGYEDGVSTRPLVYDSSFNFTQNTAKTISLGSEYCDLHIYRMKVYNSSLTATDILNNFIADARSADEMINRYNRNQIYNENGLLDPDTLAEKCPNLRIIKISAPYFTNNKSDKVPNTTITHIYKDGDPTLDNWTAYDCCHSGQGTSSNNYGAAGRNLDLIMKTVDDYGNNPYIVLGDGKTRTDKVSLTRTSVPVNYFNLKVNIASSNNLTNPMLARRYNEFNPYTRPFVREDESVIPYIKDTMEFYNCVVFIQETNTDMSTHREFADNNWHKVA